MAKYLINDWSKGAIIDNDLIDVNGFGKGATYRTENIVIKGDKKLVLRPLGENKVTSDIVAEQTLCFKEFTILKTSTTTARFILALDQDTIKRYDESGGSYSLGTEVDNHGATISSGDFAYFRHINNVARGGFWSGWGDTAALSCWYGYINGRGYYNDAATLTNWLETDSRLYAPYISEYAIDDTAAGDVAMPGGTYFFRMTYVYDGYQEGWFKDHDDTASAQTITVTPDEAGSRYMEIVIYKDYTEGSYTLYETNKRVTAINIYCAYSETASASTPDTPYYLIAEVSTNDTNWGASATARDYEITVNLKANAADSLYPSGYYTDGIDNGVALGGIVEELYTRCNAVVGVTEGYDLLSYMDSVYINGRNFVTRPVFTTTVTGLPYDPRQVVLFSHLNKPDSFDGFVNYIDVSTPEGDEVVGVAEHNGSLIILKKRNMFKINFNNSGQAFNWTVVESYQNIGCRSAASITNGEGYLFWAGDDHIYMYDGYQVKAISKDRISELYRSELTDSVTYIQSIFGAFDPISKFYYLVSFDFSTYYQYGYCFIYDLLNDRWHMNKTALGAYAGLCLGVDYDILVYDFQVGGNKYIRTVNDDAGNDESSADVYYYSNWLSLNGNIEQQKKINYVKIIHKSNNTGGTFTLRIYKDLSRSASVTATITESSSAYTVNYVEITEIGYVFVIGLESAATTVFDIYGIEIDYEVLEAKR